jgi:anthranilate synthase component 1
MASEPPITPGYAEFRRLARRGNRIPVFREILADLETPVSAFLKMASHEPSSFLLESVEHGEKIGRYSFMGCAPSQVLVGNGRDDLTRQIEGVMKKKKAVPLKGMPAFCGGWVGYLGYECVRHFESVRFRGKPGLEIPESVFFLVDRFVIFDHVEHTIKLVAVCSTEGGVRRAYEAGKEAVCAMTADFRRTLRGVSQLHRTLPDDERPWLPSPNMRRGDFERRVRRIKEYIRQGDCIQVVFSQRFDLGKIADDFEVYRALRSINPSPYMFYFRHRALSLIGSSPEVLVRKTGRRAEIRPIAGTRRRGDTDEEDQALEKELRTSPKELAEHLMLVDLGRNDLGRVCRYKTVRVKDYARIERYSHVMHLVSEVTGELRSREDAFSLLRATFPAGTVTGAPKIRAMGIVDELEGTRRGPYAGALGYLSFGGDMDMCIMIRTIVVKGGHAYVQAGAGVVYDSDPAHEYQETVNKARALFQAVHLAGRAKP